MKSRRAQCPVVFMPTTRPLPRKKKKKIAEGWERYHQLFIHMALAIINPGQKRLIDIRNIDLCLGHKAMAHVDHHHVWLHIYIYIYIYVCVCVCVCIYIYRKINARVKKNIFIALSFRKNYFHHQSLKRKYIHIYNKYKLRIQLKCK